MCSVDYAVLGATQAVWACEVYIAPWGRLISDTMGTLTNTAMRDALFCLFAINEAQLLVCLHGAPELTAWPLPPVKCLPRARLLAASVFVTNLAIVTDYF